MLAGLITYIEIVKCSDISTYFVLILSLLSSECALPCQVPSVQDVDTPDAGTSLRLVATVEQIKEDTEGSLQKFLNYAERCVNQFVKIVQEQDSATVQSECFQNSCFCKDATSQERPGHCGVIYNVSSAGESSSCAHVRPPRFRAEHLKKYVQACCTSRGDVDTLPADTLFFVSDAGRHGNESDAQEASQNLCVEQFPRTQAMMEVSDQELLLDASRLARQLTKFNCEGLIANATK